MKDKQYKILEHIKKIISELNEEDYDIELSINPIISDCYYYDNNKNKTIHHKEIRYERVIVIQDKNSVELENEED